MIASPFVRAVAFYGLVAASTVSAASSDPTASIASGIVVGTLIALSSEPSATAQAKAFLGVPFAASPPLRFAPPSLPPSWSQPLLAQTLPAACLQQFANGSTGQIERSFFNNPGLPPPAESEDCLYLNVYAPKAAKATNLKPVMFWLFGGNLQFGTASLSYYDGSSFAVNQDVVVVVPNYRTNIFGFSNSPEIPFGQQNSGFLDQRFALQWVQDNIRSFGGDPSQVTIFGESAGAYSVKQLLANPPNPLPFRGAIMESAGTSILGNGSLNYAQVASHFGCQSATSPLACLRQVSGQEILNYITEQSLGFAPVNNDGTFSASNTLPQILSGKFAPVPLLIGTNRDEARVFLAVLGLNNGSNVVDSVLALTGLDVSGIENSILATYAGDIVQDVYRLISRIATDLVFTCTTASFAATVFARSRQPVWRYRYDAVFPNVALFADPGAYHTVEIPEVWGTYPLQNQYGNVTSAQVSLSQYMQGAWARFAKNPSGGPGWPKLGSNFGFELGILGGSNSPTNVSVQPLAEADYPCPVYQPLLLLDGTAF